MNDAKFIKGQWYVHNKKYYQYSHDEDLGKKLKLHYFRKAGSEEANSFYHDTYKYVDEISPASLIPDFTDAREGDACFSAQCGNETILSLKVYGIGMDEYVWIGTSSNFAYTKEGKASPLQIHPTLFNSFAQFMAYWQEKALEIKE